MYIYISNCLEIYSLFYLHELDQSERASLFFPHKLERVQIEETSTPLAHPLDSAS